MRTLGGCAAVAGIALGLALGLGGARDSRAQASTEHVIQAVPGNKFDKPMLVIKAGDTVTWKNAGGFHNVNLEDRSFRCSNGCDQTGGNGDPSGNSWSFSLTFEEPGMVPYFCEVHGNTGGRGMSGVIIVQP